MTSATLAAPENATQTPPANPPSTGTIVDVSPGEVAAWMKDGSALLIDVREPREYAAQRIDSSLLLPLATLRPDQIPADAHGKRIVLHCQAGIRSRKAANAVADVLAARGHPVVYCLVGGIEAWSRAGLPVVRSGRAHLPVMQQSLLVAGLFVLVGTVLAATVSPWWLLMTGFVGCGLMVAGSTGFCLMAVVLGRMPWNRSNPVHCPVASGSAAAPGSGPSSIPSSQSCCG